MERTTSWMSSSEARYLEYLGSEAAAMASRRSFMGSIVDVKEMVLRLKIN